MGSITGKRSAARFAVVLGALAVMLCLAFTPRAFADVAPCISYDGASRQLTVQGAEGSATATDLFPAFKGLMPGDARQQDVQLNVKGATSQVRLYVRAVVDDETAQALQPVTLAASVFDGSAFSRLQAASAGHVFAGKTLVATFSGNGDAVLRLQLAVPTSVSNELSGASKQVRWEITAEDDSGAIAVNEPEAPSSNVFSRLAQTGDVAVSFAVAAALLVLGAVGAGLARRRCRHRP